MRAIAQRERKEASLMECELIEFSHKGPELSRLNPTVRRGVGLGAIASEAMDTSRATTVCVGAPLLYVRAGWQSADVDTTKFIVVSGKKQGPLNQAQNNMKPHFGT